MSDIRTRRAVLRAAALFAVMALLAACSDSSPTTSVDDTEATTAPTTAPSETTVTTEAPTTTEGTTETTTGTTDTTVADEGAEMIPVEPEEGLARTFPVSAGWIVGPVLGTWFGSLLLARAANWPRRNPKVP